MSSAQSPTPAVPATVVTTINGRIIALAQQSLGQTEAGAIFQAAWGLGEADPDLWYPAATWFSACRQLAGQVAEETLQTIGAAVADGIVSPMGAVSPHAVLATVHTVFQTYNCGESSGIVAYVPTGPHSAEIFTSTQMPCAMSMGYFTAVVQRAATTAKLVHTPRGCRNDGATSCVYHVVW
ncbi:MAG: hypothetical protein H7338_23980 [Candidatus Sericytochromatia bacterium]|nr:hypothetical protein [Candidatus Sericytochromatia bacterium]